ncbi:serine/threonine transporter SstT [Schleiferilactobacillus harbinensis]|jgi:serine/threonine transporter|uniref:serine/threonine transporter SstT n=1 Tax=Schleiferilactobacillus harbinensis TaxID=304207 RepID=UPI001AAE1C0D|nr:serine/threonine transporter SstT [Schleiferilactobacillus harbinensis]MBO3091176.1 serine/threonine transporter SstT [Schleiferilactobacillus harbinensis]
MFKRYRSISLIIRILIGIVIGTTLALIVPQWSFISILGDLFVGALKAIAPLMVFFIIMSALAQYETGSKNHFSTVIVLYMAATFIAALTAVAVSYIFPVSIVFPKGTHVTNAIPKGLGPIIQNLLTNAVSNPLKAITDANYLAILFWSLLFGVTIRKTGPTIRHSVQEIANTISSVAQFIIEFAPFGIVGLVFNAVSQTGLAGVVRYGQLVVLLVGTMAFVYLVVYAGMAWIMTGQNPYPLIFWTLKVSGIPAFFTRSSAVNIPINMQASADLGLDESSYGVSIPLGGSANSGGAAVTITVMTLAATHTLGISVSFPLAFILCLLTAISATGASGIAGGSLLLIPMAASLFGISNDIAIQVVGVGFIIGVIQDAVETAVNSASDLLFTAVAEYHDEKKAGRPVDIVAAVKAANARRH